MKKGTILFSGLVLSVSLLTTTPVNASPYVGFGLNLSDVDYLREDITLTDGSVEPDVERNRYNAENFNGFIGYAGYKFNKNYSLEISYTYFMEGEESTYLGTIGTIPVDLETEVKLSIIDLDNIYTCSIDNKIGLYGSIGASYIMYEEKMYLTGGGLVDELIYDGDEKGFGANFGLGLEFKLDKAFSVRSGIKYTKTFMDSIDNIVGYNIGIKYSY